MADQWTGKLDPYLDGELPSAEMRALDEHVRSCPDCMAAVMNRLHLKRSVHDAGTRYTPRPEFRQKIQSSIAERKRVSPWRTWMAVAASMAVILIAAAVFSYRDQRQAERGHVFNEIADLHVVALASPNTVDVPSSDRHTVKPWFQGKIPFSFNLPELQNSDFTLVGGRLAYLGQAPGAQLIYQLRQHRISVFVFREDQVVQSLPGDGRAERESSFNQQTWKEGGLRYFVIGDAGPEELEKLSAMLKGAGGS